MTDKIFIRNLEIAATLGVFPHERTSPRKVIINLIIECDLSRPSLSDDLSDSIDYEAVRNRVVSVVENASDFLIERLAYRVAEAVLEFQGVKRVTITVDKPNALQSCDSAAVEITRQNKRI